MTQLEVNISKEPSAALRETIFVSHAAPEDNEFALWLSSKLSMAGYRVWIDRRRLRGGDDRWDEIDRVLRTEAIKQIVVFTRSIGKPGVKKELAIGEVMKRKLLDPKFMIPIRVDAVEFSDAPPEFLRADILDAYPNWHDCLHDLFLSLEDGGVPRGTTPDAHILRAIVDAREDGRRLVMDRSESVLTNWFPITPPRHINYYKYDGPQKQWDAHVEGAAFPLVRMGRLVGSFADRANFIGASDLKQQIEIAYRTQFADFLQGSDRGPYDNRSGLSNDVANLFRQHFNALAEKRGLKPFHFANGDVGWFFPDGLVPGNQVAFLAPDGRRVRRTMTGKFKKLRWHLCVIAKPRISPLVYRIHGNVVLSQNNVVLAGEKTHTRRRRLTRSWWNDVWRDRILAAAHFLANGSEFYHYGSWPRSFRNGQMATHLRPSCFIRCRGSSPAQRGRRRRQHCAHVGAG